MYVVLDCLTRGLGRSCEQRPDVDVEPEICKRGGDHLLPAVVTVLSDLGDKNARPPAFTGLELADALLHARDGFRHGADLPLVYTGDRSDRCAVTTKHLLQRGRDLADCCLAPRRLDREREQVAVAA